MLLLAWIRKIYKALSADGSPSAIAFGAAFGFTAGCVPVTSGAFLFMLLLLMIFRVQFSAGILCWAIARIITFAGGGYLFVGIGEALLYTESLQGFWTWLLNAPGFAWSGFRYQAVLGGFVFGALVGGLSFVPVRLTVIAYRKWAHEKLSNNRFFKWITNIWLVKLLKWGFVRG